MAWSTICFLIKSHVKTYINKLNSKKSCPKTALTNPFYGLANNFKIVLMKKIYVAVFVDPSRPAPPVHPRPTPGAQPILQGPAEGLAQTFLGEKFREGLICLEAPAAHMNQWPLPSPCLLTFPGTALPSLRSLWGYTVQGKQGRDFKRENSSELSLRSHWFVPQIPCFSICGRGKNMSFRPALSLTTAIAFVCAGLSYWMVDSLKVWLFFVDQISYLASSWFVNRPSISMHWDLIAFKF